MPELPEVENVRRSLEMRIRGCSIQALSVRFPGVLLDEPENSASLFPLRILSLTRKGKYMAWHLDHDHQLVVHLRMTGGFYFRADTELPRPHTHVEFLMENGGWLSFCDPRRFGRIWWIVDPSRNPMANLGEDALEMSRSDFVKMLGGMQRQIKPLLLDQTCIAGMGNIYTDEALHRARIHPRQASNAISSRKAGALWDCMREILTESVEKGGSTIRDFSDSEGVCGNYQMNHQVYQRESEPCPHCATPIRRTVVAQRGTYYCPACQREKKKREG